MSGDTMVCEPSGLAATNLVIVSSTQITASCPDGTSTVTVTAPAPPPTTYPFILCVAKCNPTPPSSLTFNGAVGGAAPVAQLLDIFDTSPDCPPVKPIPYCGWPNTTVTSDSSWLKSSMPSGTTEFKPNISVVLTGLAAGTYKGNITITQSLFTTPTLKVPVTLVVSGTTPPPPQYSVDITWTPGIGGLLATSFEVTRASSSAGPLKQLGTSLTPSYVDSTVSSGLYCYEVIGVAGSNISSPSNSLCVTIPSGATSKRGFWSKLKHLFT